MLDVSPAARTGTSGFSRSAIASREEIARWQARAEVVRAEADLSAPPAAGAQVAGATRAA